MQGARIQLYAATAGAAEPTALLSHEVRSDASGRFEIDDSLPCSSSVSQLYVVASGGATASQSGTSNDALTLIAPIGNCSDPSRAQRLDVSELTTVSAVSALGSFMKGATSISASKADAQALGDAFGVARALAGILEQSNASAVTSRAYPEFLSRLITVANVLSLCTNSAGGDAAVGSQCGVLLSYAKASDGTAPMDTANALLEISRNPNHNVSSIYSLRPSVEPFSPSLGSAPDSWKMSAASSMPAPAFSPLPGSYVGTQEIALSEQSSGAWVFYNVGGSWLYYTGPFSLPTSTTIHAIAIGAGVSALVSGSYTITAPALSVAVLANVVAGGAGTGTITLNSAAPAGGTIIHLTSSAPAISSVSPGTVTVSQGRTTVTFPYQGVSTGIATLSASATGFVPAAAQVTVTAPVSVTLSPAQVALTSSQSQQFQAAVTNTTNTGVTWTVSPAVGSISATGLYTAPNSILSYQNVTVTATSVADPTKGATSTISLSPPVSLTVTPASVSLSSAATQIFTATVTNSSNTAVVWSVSGASCSGSSCGTITANGTYTAPTTISTMTSVNITAISQASPTAAASAIVTLTPPAGNTYYLSPNGSDTNSGHSATAAWLTPNHSLNCGDVILAAPGAYNNANFNTGKWGTVTCPTNNNVAWLQCQTFDGCKINASTNQGMWVDKSYWGVEGWEVTTAASDLYGTCFMAQPNWQTPVTIHHIIFANDVANGCSQGGFSTTPNTGSLTGVDYIAVLGSIAYNTTQGSDSCTSGISIWEPVQSDTAAGTHIYIAGNFSFANLNPSSCNGTSPTDGEGIIFDTFDGRQTQGKTPYTAQAVAYNNLLVGNGGKGLEVYNNQVGSSHADIYLEQNTVWGNLTDPHQTWLGCGELAITLASDTEASGNIFATKGATGCGGNAIYGMALSGGDTTDSIVSNFASGYSGNNTFIYNSGSFSFGSSNTLGTNPSFANATVPGAPACSGTANTVACMASMVHNFTPTATGSAPYGYQPVSSTSVYDPLYPRWLCTAQIPSGLITNGCQATPQ